MAVNKVIYNGETLINLTGDTVKPETLAEGVTAHDASGKPIVGTLVGIPKATKIKYIIPATYIPKRTSDDNGFDVTQFTFTRENVNQLFFVNWRLQDETNFATNGFWVQDIIWNLYYQGNYNSVHNLSICWWGGGNKGHHGIIKYLNFGKTVLTQDCSIGNNTTTDANYKRHGTTYKGLIFIYDSSYDGAPIVDETKLTQFFTCDYLTEGM